MERSHNGWPVSPNNSALIHITRYRVPRIEPTIYLSVRREVAPILLNVAKSFHRKVDHLGNPRPDDGGYNPRKIPNTDIWSNHASGTAIDLNWSKYPMGVRNMTADQREACRWIVRHYRVIRWGGEWSGTGVDEMHFEIAPDVTLDDVLRVKRELGLTIYGVKRRAR